MCLYRLNSRQMRGCPEIRLIRRFIFLLNVFVLGCIDSPVRAQTGPLPPEDAPAYRVILLGNIGGGDSGEVQEMLRTHLDETDKNSAVVFLGDELSCCGFPDSAKTDHTPAFSVLSEWLDVVKGYRGDVIYLPGNREGEHVAERRDGLIREAQFIETTLGKEGVFPLRDGFPGPIAMPLSGDITLIALNTQWWLDEDQQYGDTGEYELNEPLDFIREFEDLLFKHRNKNLLVVGFHPLFTNGNHGGRFSFLQHMTPLPILGSAMPLYRQLVGRPQDLASSRYRLFRQEMLAILRNQHNLIYAASHDYSLQYFRKEDRRRVKHHIVSGSASRSDHVSKGRGANFAAGEQGFMVVEYFDDGSVWLQAWTPSPTSSKGEPAYRTQLVAPDELLVEREASALPELEAMSDTTVVQSINPRYAQPKNFTRVLFGEQYRDLWAVPVEVPVLDWANEAGGLTPLKVGGQSQSVTLRMMGGNGKYYMLRSIDKLPVRSLSTAMRQTFAGTIIQDQVAMQHPFGAFVVPHLAEAAGVFHTNPRLVFVPPDSRLNVSNEALVGQVVLFEERADEDVSDIKSFGNASNVIGSAKLFQEINGDNDHRVQARAFARARLLDMLIADHDRTLDNFRWGAFEPYELNPDLEGKAREEGKIYMPIPTDRDKAFSKSDGFFPGLYRILAEPAWQSFSKKYGYIRGLNKKGLPLDRRFTAELTREDWVSIADSIRRSLTDEIIIDAVETWPSPVFEQAGEEMIETLQVRRDKLPEVADTYYDVLASVIDVVGSDKHEFFRVSRVDDERTEVVMYKYGRDGVIRKELFRRQVLTDETKEIRLYGQGGIDRFEIEGKVEQGPRVIIVGGPGEDTIIDESEVKKGRRKTIVYDVGQGTEVEGGPETKTRLSSEIDVNAYEFEGFKPNLTRPVAYFGSNQDDGLFIGGGFKRSVHGFRKSPHASTHQLMGNFAARTQAFNVQYMGHYVDVFGDWDLRLDAAFFNPNNIRNFYGLGNDTPNNETFSRFYQARFSRFLVKPLFEQALDSGIQVSIGPALEITDVRLDEERFIGQPQPGISDDSFDQLFFAGLEARLDVKTVDNALNPRQGFRFTGSADINTGIVETNDTYTNLASSISLYMSPSLSPQVTLALRVGGAHNIGSFPFFDSNTLGGNANLRGYRSTRFAGRTSFYHNVEARVELLDFASYFGYGTVGLMGFLDNGRVWADDESSRTWHQGYGGGLWVSVFDQLLINNTVGFSEENTTFSLNFGFLF